MWCLIDTRASAGIHRQQGLLCFKFQLFVLNISVLVLHESKLGGKVVFSAGSYWQLRLNTINIEFSHCNNLSEAPTAIWQVTAVPLVCFLCVSLGFDWAKNRLTSLCIPILGVVMDWLVFDSVDVQQTICKWLFYSLLFAWMFHL